MPPAAALTTKNGKSPPLRASRPLQRLNLGPTLTHFLLNSFGERGAAACGGERVQPSPRGVESASEARTGGRHAPAD